MNSLKTVFFRCSFYSSSYSSCTWYVCL